MGRVFRIWHGDWKKNGEEQWHFLPNHQDYGFTTFMDSPETLEEIDATIRENYMLGSETPVLITYGMPDWMMFPSGPSPPITLTSTSDLVRLLIRRPPPADITLLVTFGAKKVAEFHFLSRSDFKIGSSTYSVGGGQDEAARARYDGLVRGERLLTSLQVMTEIFGEQEMLILHRVALEMSYADRVLGTQNSTGVVQGVEIIQLDDDDDEMVEASQMARTPNGTLGGTRGAIVPFQPQPLAEIPPAQAPSVFWDVGMDMLDYPEFYNAQRDGRLVTADSAFWNEIIDENYQSLEGVYLLTNNSHGTEVGLTQGESSTGSTAIVCNQLGAKGVETEIGNEGNGGDGIEAVLGKTTEEVNNSLPGPSLTLTLACGQEESGVPPPPTAYVDNTSSEESDKEGGY
ncbi:Uncharacterized protein Rs2_01510 [Raphanus sativus]|nr:Uncharacterized protein Rs2_01510 [Raphanus sativus]